MKMFIVLLLAAVIIVFINKLSDRIHSNTLSEFHGLARG